MLCNLICIFCATRQRVHSPLIGHFPHHLSQVYFVNISSLQVDFNAFLKIKSSTSLRCNSQQTNTTKPCNLLKYTLWCVLTNVYPSLIMETTKIIQCFHHFKMFSCISLKLFPFHLLSLWKPLGSFCFCFVSSFDCSQSFLDFNRNGITYFVGFFLDFFQCLKLVLRCVL